TTTDKRKTDVMKQLILALAISTIIIGAHPLTMSVPAQGAAGSLTSCKSEYDLCRRVRADPVRTKPNPAMIGSCEARYAKAQQTGVGKSRWAGSGNAPVRVGRGGAVVRRRSRQPANSVTILHAAIAHPLGGAGYPAAAITERRDLSAGRASAARAAAATE